jgi:hypothetical protein
MEQASMTSAYMWSCVVMAVCFLIAVVIANMILFKPGNTGVTHRRIWFWILCVATGIVGFLINYGIGSNITVPSIQANYYMHSGIAAGVSVVIYIILGLVLSKMFSNSKIGTWF